MDTKYQNLLYLLGRALFGDNREPLPCNTDWRLLYEEARSHSVTLLVYDCLEPCERDTIPQQILERWHQSAFTTLWWNEQIMAEQRKVLQSFADANISCTVLKGISSAKNYPKPELRAAGDIDLLIKPEDRMVARKLMRKQGYALPDDRHHCHDSMAKGKLVVELHWEPNGLPQNTVGQNMRQYFMAFPERTVIIDGIPMLEPCAQALVLLLHKLEHIINGGLGLRQMCDWAVFVHKELTSGVWKSLAPLLESYGLLLFTKVVTRICIEWLCLPKKDAEWSLDADFTLCSSLLEDILRTGNFGKKEDRYGQRLFTDPGAGNRLSSLFRIGISTCRVHWPLCRRFPILLPVAPIMLLFRYRKQREEGKRPKFHPIKMYRGAAQRQKLNSALRPFLDAVEKD